MSRISLPIIAASLLALSPAHAQESDISVAEYLEIWSKIDAVGIQKAMQEGGEFDIEKFPNAKRASNEVGAIAKAYREKFNADKAAGRPTESCLPEGEAEVNSDTLIAHLESYDEAKRGKVTLKQAFADLMAKTYLCTISTR